MVDTPSLSRHTRAFIVLVAVLQGGLMYLAQKGLESNWWLFSELGGRVYWYTLVLTVPTMMTLTVIRLRDPRFWQHVAIVGVIFVALASWASWSATGAPGLDSSAVLGPFGVSAAIALFGALPWLQCRLAHGRWRAPYPELFEHAWQNALTLALAALFTGICWVVLHLWASLFKLINIDLFEDLFTEKAFIYLATGAMVGLGILLGRTQQGPIRVARQILLAICKGLLPLLAFIAVLFIVSLPFTGLEPLWGTRSAAGLLIALTALLIIFVNAVYQDGNTGTPYPAWLRKVVEAGLLVMPLFSLLALYALWLRVDQYGWTAERFWAVLVAAVAAAYAFGYAWAVLRPRRGWLFPLRRVNMTLSWAVIGVVVLANLPVLDPHRIGVASQLKRLGAGEVQPDEMDLDYLRFHSGRRGYAAAQALREHPAFAGDPDLTAELERVLARTSRYGRETEETREARRLKSPAEVQAHISLAEGSAMPGDEWWSKLIADEPQGLDCLLPENECVVLTLNLDDDGRDEHLLCAIRSRTNAHCRLYAFENGRWTDSGGAYFYADRKENDLRQALRAGRIEIHHRRWPDLSVEDGRVTGID